MSFYGANVNGKLYIGTSTATPLPAPGADTFTEVPLQGSITPPANELSTAFFNVLNDGNRRSVGGTLGDRTAPGNVVIDWDDSPIHSNMYADSIIAGGRKRNWRIVYPNTNARQLDFVGFISSWTESAFDAGEEAVEHRADFVITVDGAITVTP